VIRRAAVVLAACGVLAPAAAAGTVVKAVYNPTLQKTILVDGRGMTLYLLTSEHGRTTACIEDCAKSWPPLYATGAPKAGPGVKRTLLGTATRPDGRKQVSYAGHLLYRWAGGAGSGAGDRKAGDVEGQGRFDVWWAVSPAGKAITKRP
jgi:predicted lipoprotein with Yx(FWY)xxD motif